MARYRVVYWQHIPTMVIADDGQQQARVSLSPRFQAAVDAYAMATGASDDASYSAGWRKTAWQERPGTAATVAQSVAAELEAEHPTIEIPKRTNGPLSP